MWESRTGVGFIYLVRMNGNDPQCAVDESISTYAPGAIWCKHFDSEAAAIAYKGQVRRTLTCGNEHQRVWGDSGYDGGPEAWCNALRGTLGSSPPPPPPSGGLGCTATPQPLLSALKRARNGHEAVAFLLHSAASQTGALEWQAAKELQMLAAGDCDPGSGGQPCEQCPLGQVSPGGAGVECTACAAAEWIDAQVTQFGLTELVEFVGHLEHPSVIRFQRECDALLVTSSKVIGGQDYSIAGKTFEYLSFRKPLLGFVARARSAVPAYDSAHVACASD